MSTPSQQILDQLSRKDGLSATALANSIGIDRREANNILIGELRGKVKQDQSYRWWLVAANTTPRQSSVEMQPQDNTLTRLCRYYLACLARDDRQKAETWASSAFNDLDYAELPHLPGDEELSNSGAQTPAIHKLVSKVRNSKGKKELLLGYPTCLHQFTTRKGETTWVVRPVLLLPIQVEANGTLAAESPIPEINPLVVRQFLETSDGDGPSDAINELREALGLAEGFDEPPTLEEIAQRLTRERPEWGWREPIDASALSGQPLAAIKEPGIYNRAILLVSDRSPYTRGLESELLQLMRMPESKWANTALGNWIRKQFPAPITSYPEPLLEVLPMNSEQRVAVERSCTHNLTVVTGPPGTGKSQVVSNLLINAAWRKQRTLFTSKNNKAVDVVESRVNSLAGRPLLLRLGTSQYHANLSAHLKTLLSGTVSSDDEQELERAKSEFQGLKEQWNRLEATIAQLRHTRNSVDAAERATTQVREYLGERRFKNWFRHAEQIHVGDWDSLLVAARKIRPGGRSIWESWLWRWMGPRRIQTIGTAVHRKNDLWIALDMMPPAREATETEWIRWFDDLAAVRRFLPCLQQYRLAFRDLEDSPSLEKMTREREKIQKQITSISKKLWDLWMRLAPKRLDANGRALLGRYTTLLDLVAAGTNDSSLTDAKSWAKFYELSEQVTSILPCWAVTSLSAKGRIPLAPGYFDLVVIDEASQCDIASILPLLFRAKRAVVIGDPNQLRHITQITAKDDRHLLQQYGVLDSLAEWSYSTKSFYDLATIHVDQGQLIWLVDHHRSHGDIIEFSNQQFYGGRLRVATRYDKLCLPPHGEPIIRWLHQDGKVERPPSGSCRNPPEAHAVVHELRRITLEQKYPGKMGVVTPFRAQENLIRELISQDSVLNAALAQHDFIVDTADGFQGDERDLILFSPVLAAGMTDGATLFLQKDVNRFNVAITRARSALVVVGDKNAALGGRWGVLKEFALYQEKLNIREDMPPEQIPLPVNTPAYPAVRNPESVSEWERILYAALYQAGIQTIPQYPVESYRLDLALTHHDRRLNIEIDGEQYHKDWTGELCRRDIIRNHRLMELGWDVQRFWVYQVRDDLDGCVSRILAWREGKQPE